MKRVAFLLAGLLAAGGLRAACEPGGMGGTGMRADGGIGGTGIQAEADLGLIGVITGFGSICVDGIEVHYDPDTPVTSAGAPASAAALALGQLVAVRAAGNGSHVRARDIQILEAVVGPASGFDRAANTLQVAGQRVRLDATTVLAAGAAPAELAGQTLRVSGLWRADGSLAATRVERAPADAAPRVARDWPELGTRRLIFEGYVSDVRPDALRVGGVTIHADARLAASVERDRLVRLSARVERDGSRVAERVDVLERGRESGPSERSGGPSSRERLERSENGGPGRPDRSERPERSDRGERIERPERPDRSGPH